MADIESKSISAVEAARRIYNTRSPSAEQVGRVVQKIAMGSLKRGEPGGPTTTMDSVAEYMARREEARGQDQRKQHGSANLAAAHEARLGNLYHGLLKDYFLAVLLRRRAGHRSGAFQGAVVATQVLLLFACLGVVAFATNRVMQYGVLPPDHRAIHAWVASKYEESQVTTIRRDPQQPANYLAEFSYEVNGRIIRSRGTFTVRGGQVTSMSSD